MKKYISYILMGMAVLCTGCDDFFSNESPSGMKGVAVFSSPEQIEQTIAGIYVILGEQNSYRARLGGYFVMPGTDCEMFAEQAPPAYAIYAMTAAGVDDLTAKGKHPWGYLTMAIERANMIVDGIETYTDTTKSQIRYLYGETLTLRAWLYYEMTKLWGDVPYMFKPMGGTDEDIYPKKVDRNLIYDKLREDLRHAAILMPNAKGCPGNTVERCNREFALGLLARVDMVYAGKAMRPDQMVKGSSYKVQFNTTPEKRLELLEEVIWACDEVFKADGYTKFMDNYEDIFKAVSSSVTDYMATESLWEIPFADGVRGRFMNMMGSYIDKSVIQNADQAKLKGITTSAKSNAKIAAVPSYILSFEQGDKRKWVTVAPGPWCYDLDSKIPNISTKVLYQKVEKITKMRFGKYRHEWMRRAMDNDEDGINMPQMRYTDVLLLYAEAAIGSVCEVGNPSNADLTKAQEFFDKLRTRAGLASKPLTMENLMQERAWEFGGEFIRKYDLMRWGVFAEKLWEAQETNKYFTVIGEDGIDFSGTPYEGQLPKKIYAKYVEDNTVTTDGSTAYRIEKLYGWALGENDKPEGDDWVEADAFTSSDEAAMKVQSQGNLIFDISIATKEQLDARQYWPIFNRTTSANPNLYNDYGY